MKKIYIGIASAAVIIIVGVLVFRLIISYQTLDKDVMENPDHTGTGQTETSPALRPEERGELIYFSWSQSHSYANECFYFLLKSSDTGHILSCNYWDPELEDFVETEDVPVSDELWKETEELLRNTELPPYSSPDPYMMDATNSCITVRWNSGEEMLEETLNGQFENGLLEHMIKLEQSCR
ncbi:MAG: hypothetical protein ACI4SF_01060 [Oscillospiraceae bacterium]